MKNEIYFFNQYVHRLVLSCPLHVLDHTPCQTYNVETSLHWNDAKEIWDASFPFTKQFKAKPVRDGVSKKKAKMKRLQKWPMSTVFHLYRLSLHCSNSTITLVDSVTLLLSSSLCTSCMIPKLLTSVPGPSRSRLWWVVDLDYGR